MSLWWVYAIQSLERRPNGKPGFFYVGSTTDPARRLRQHNGSIKGGGRYTSMHRPWEARALYGPYANRSEAFRAEMSLKHSKRGPARIAWTPQDSKWCRGLGPDHPWAKNPLLRIEEFGSSQ
jgi:predicted GIY-YIG superfamily endonuclease